MTLIIAAALTLSGCTGGENVKTSGYYSVVDNKCVLNNCLMAVVVPKSAKRTSESLKNTLSAYF